MSNVLIGIIGVILFIGLALAGALFLGPRFQESTNNSKASAAVQAAAQISSAANLAGVQQGTLVAPTAAALEALQADGFLKSMPGNPSGSTAPSLFSSNGGSSADMVIMPVDSEAVCTAAARQSGLGSDYVAISDGKDVLVATAAFPAGTSGCAKIEGNAQTGDGLYVFSRV